MEDFKERTSKELEDLIDKSLREWAVKFSDVDAESESSKKDDSLEETYRTRFRRHKDRILYTKDYRHLQNKTQVVYSGNMDNQRTRMSHTSEVAQIATSVAESLCANKDLAEAIAVGHDIGHMPFGHAAEKELDKILLENNAGGFSHSIQSVRIIDSLAKRYDSGGERTGLGVSRFILEGILKHDSDIINQDLNCNKQYDCSSLQPDKPGFFEAQIVYWADKIAYLSHDWEDFKTSRIEDSIKPFLKNKKSEVYKDYEEMKKALKNICSYKDNIIEFEEIETRDIIRCLIKKLIKQTTEKINQNMSKIKRYEDVIEINNNEYQNKLKDKKEADRKAKDIYIESLFVNLPTTTLQDYNTVRRFLNSYYIGSNTVKTMDTKAKKIVRDLFEAYKNDYRLLPLDYIFKIEANVKEENKIDEVFKIRVIADYIAGMTDRYAIKKHNELFKPGSEQDE